MKQKAYFCSKRKVIPHRTYSSSIGRARKHVLRGVGGPSCGLARLVRPSGGFSTNIFYVRHLGMR